MDCLFPVLLRNRIISGGLEPIYPRLYPLKAVYNTGNKFKLRAGRDGVPPDNIKGIGQGNGQLRAGFANRKCFQFLPFIDVGEALGRHKDVDAVSFTGSTEVANLI